MVFGWLFRKDDRLVGAHEKHTKANQYSEIYKMRAQGERRAKSNDLLAVLLVFALCIGFSVLLSEGVLKEGMGLGVGVAAFDKLLFGPGVPALTGIPDTDYSLAVVLRALVIFMLGAIVPVCAFLWQTLLDRASMNVYITFWGAGVVLAMGAYVGWDMIVSGTAFLAGLLF